jgi:hypothetical protein
MPAAARQPPHPSWIELSATLDFMFAALVGNGAAWSVATLPAIKVNSYPLPTRFWPAPPRSSMMPITSVHGHETVMPTWSPYVCCWGQSGVRRETGKE